LEKGGGKNRKRKNLEREDWDVVEPETRGGLTKFVEQKPRTQTQALNQRVGGKMKNKEKKTSSREQKAKTKQR